MKQGVDRVVLASALRRHRDLSAHRLQLGPGSTAEPRLSHDGRGFSLLPLTLLLTLFLLAASPLRAGSHGLDELNLVRPGRPQPAKEFSVPGLDGKELRLSDYRGKVVLLNFWATREWDGQAAHALIESLLRQ